MLNFDSLFRVKTNLQLLIVAGISVLLLFPDLSWYSFFAIIICLHQFNLLFNSIGSVIPIRFLFGSFMCLQMLLGPMLAYNGLDQYQTVNYKMKIPEAAYFAYVLPAVLAFILGLHVNAGKLKGELIDEERIKNFVQRNEHISYMLIGIGFLASVLSATISSQLAFLFVLLGGLKFVGAFMLIIGNRKLKPIPLIIVFGSVIGSSLGMGMFHDLLTWLIILGCILAIKFKPSISTKRVVTFLFIVLSLTIQQLKGGYREATWQKGEEAGLATMGKAYTESAANNELFSFHSLAISNVRFNQGFIITNIMSNIPQNMPFANGAELYVMLESAFLPRIIAPNKLDAGDRDFFMKYSGMRIALGTSMGLSSVGDGYINFGIVGGCIFMFFLGLLFNEVLKAFHKYEKNFPILLLFTPLVFYYPIRPDCELQTILGHVVKSCFLIFVIFAIWKNQFGFWFSNIKVKNRLDN